MSRRPFSTLLDWFYLHCADNHAAIEAKKGMINVTVWTTMSYVLNDFLDDTAPIDNMTKQFTTDFVPKNKCDGAHALFHSLIYV